MKNFYFLVLFCCLQFIAAAQPVIGFTPVITSGLTSPVDIANAGDGTNRLFIVQQNGIIKIDSAGVLLSTPFLDVSSIVLYDGGERGLLSLAFHPGYATNRYFFIYYSDASGNVTVAQYRTSAVNPDVADPASGKILINIPKPFTNHNGGKLNFGPDGNLYFGTGDGGSGGDPNNNAQNGHSLLGKMIRLNVDNFTTPPYFTVPASNPFVGSSTVYDSIYALGLRNPWRWSFDKLTGDMWIADVGQDLHEEVNFRTPANMSGVNYGWRCYEGLQAYNLSACGASPALNKVFPIFEYGHTADSGYVIAGGYVYRGAEFPALQGYYMCCDEETTNGWLIKSDGFGGWNVREQNDFPTNTCSFGEAEDGTLYALSITGKLFKIIVTGVLPVNLLSFTATNANGKDILQWAIASSPSLKKFEIQQSTNGTFFISLDSVPALTGTDNRYQYASKYPVSGTRYYRLKIISDNGVADYSSIVKLEDNVSSRITIVHNSAGQFEITTPYALNAINIINTNGELLMRYGTIAAGTQTIDLGHLPSGTYIVQCISGKTENFKIIN